MPNPETRAIPKATLAYLFPQGFNEFWQKTGMKEALEQIIYSYVPATLEREEIKKTLASGGYGWSTVAIAGHFTERYWYSQFEPWPDEFMAKFKTNLIFVISDIRRKEHLWSQVYRELDKLFKPLKLKTDTRTSQNYDKTQQIGGKTVNTGNESHQWNEQKSANQKNTPSFSNVDLSSAEFGGFARQQQLSTQTNEQNQGNRNREHKNTTDKINHINQEHYRSKKDENVSTTTQDTLEWASVARILNNFSFTIIDFTQYYKLFDKLMIKMFGVSVIPVIDPVTGQRKYVPQHDYEEIRETEGGRPILPEGNEWDETLPYLERVTIYRNKTEKDYKVMPVTSNRRPRIARRLEVLNGLVKAEEKLANEEIVWATLQEFDEYCQTYIIGYQKFISIMRAQLASQLFYQGTGEKVPQGLYLLLGPPGIGKSYICQELAKAMKRGFHSVDMNGKHNGSIIFGANMENPGADIGEVIKAIGIKTQDPYSFIAFDEYEKSHGAAKSAVGDVTDMTKNQFFKDELVDFPYNLENVTFFATGNYPWQVEGFIFSRFTRVEIEILSWEQRIEILRRLLFGFREMKGKIQGLERVLEKKGMLTERVKEYLANLNNLALLKRFLTQHWGIRQSKNNALLVVKGLNAFFAERKELPSDPINYNWGFSYGVEKGELCSELHQTATNERPDNCQCWDASQVEDWEENMEEQVW